MPRIISSASSCVILGTPAFSSANGILPATGTFKGVGPSRPAAHQDSLRGAPYGSSLPTASHRNAAPAATPAAPAAMARARRSLGPDAPHPRRGVEYGKDAEDRLLEAHRRGPLVWEKVDHGRALDARGLGPENLRQAPVRRAKGD